MPSLLSTEQLTQFDWYINGMGRYGQLNSMDEEIVELTSVNGHSILCPRNDFFKRWRKTVIPKIGDKFIHKTEGEKGVITKVANGYAHIKTGSTTFQYRFNDLYMYWDQILNNDLERFDNLFPAAQKLGQARKMNNSVFIFNSDGTFLTVRDQTHKELFLQMTENYPRRAVQIPGMWRCYQVEPIEPHYKGVPQIWCFNENGNLVGITYPENGEISHVPDSKPPVGFSMDVCMS